MVVKLAQELQDTQDQLGPTDTTDYVFKLFNAQIPTITPTVKLTRVEIGNAFTVGHAVNGIIGTANGEGGGQITIGTGGLGSSTVSRISSMANTFAEGLRDTEYTNTTNTTATVDTNNYKITF